MLLGHSSSSRSMLKSSPCTCKRVRVCCLGTLIVRWSGCAQLLNFERRQSKSMSQNSRCKLGPFCHRWPLWVPHITNTGSKHTAESSSIFPSASTYLLGLRSTVERGQRSCVLVSGAISGEAELREHLAGSGGGADLFGLCSCLACILGLRRTVERGQRPCVLVNGSISGEAELHELVGSGCHDLKLTSLGGSIRGWESKSQVVGSVWFV